MGGACGAFKKTAGDILRELRASEKAPGAERIFTAGEKEYLAKIDTADKGVLINEAVQKELLEVQKDLGLDKYDLGF